MATRITLKDFKTEDLILDNLWTWRLVYHTGKYQ